MLKLIEFLYVEANGAGINMVIICTVLAGNADINGGKGCNTAISPLIDYAL